MCTTLRYDKPNRSLQSLCIPASNYEHKQMLAVGLVHDLVRQCLKSDLYLTGRTAQTHILNVHQMRTATSQSLRSSTLKKFSFSDLPLKLKQALRYTKVPGYMKFSYQVSIFLPPSPFFFVGDHNRCSCCKSSLLIFLRLKLFLLQLFHVTSSRNPFSAH